MLKNLTVRNFLTVIFFAKKNITKKIRKNPSPFYFFKHIISDNKNRRFSIRYKKRLAASGYEAYLAEKFSAGSRKAAALLLKHIRKGEKE